MPHVFYYVHLPPSRSHFFFFNDTATTEIYTLSLHDALPILTDELMEDSTALGSLMTSAFAEEIGFTLDSEIRGHERAQRSEEHTSELQSHLNLVCRLLLEKKKK